MKSPYSRILDESSLIPYIERLCAQHSMLDMDKQIGIYRKVFVVRIIYSLVVLWYITYH